MIGRTKSGALTKKEHVPSSATNTMSATQAARKDVLKSARRRAPSEVAASIGRSVTARSAAARKGMSSRLPTKLV